MTKTVCDICGCDNKILYHRELPMYKKYVITSCSKELMEFTKIELSEADLCSDHCIMLADFIETIKENTHVL